LWYVEFVASFEHFERGYLLPEGCKDLIDVINLETHSKGKVLLKPLAGPPTEPSHSDDGDLVVSEDITVNELASLLKHEPVKIIADLMRSGIFANLNQPLGFEAISKIAHRYGYVAKRCA
jgi:hypothetical protein